MIMGSFTFNAHNAGLVFGNVPPIGHGVTLVSSLRIRLVDEVEDSQPLAASLNHSAYNIANALGG